MKVTKDHISLETAKLLKDCGIYSNYVFSNPGGVWIVVHSYDIMPDIELYPAFTWQEILWENKNKILSGVNIPAYDYHLLKLLQQNKYEEADLYFREHCILIK